MVTWTRRLSSSALNHSSSAFAAPVRGRSASAQLAWNRSTISNKFCVARVSWVRKNLFEMVERYHANCPEAERPLTGAANAEELWFSALDDSLRVQVTIKTDGRFHKHLSLGEKRIETLATDVVQHAESDDDFEIITGYNQRIRQDEVFVNEIVFIDSLGKSVKYADAWEHLGAFFKRLKKAGALG